MDKKIKDERFAHILKDPKFRKIPKGKQKVKIDKRFQSMFKDKKFAVKYTIDKRGRPVNQTTSEDFRKYYDLSSEEEDSTSSDESKSNEECKDSDLDSSKSDLDIDNEIEIQTKKKLKPEVRKKLRDLTVDYARGDGVLLSDSSSEEGEDSGKECDGDDDIEHNWGELDKEAETTEEATYRLAACNLDWDRIRAIDLMVLFNSFLPPTGLIRNVTIYPSEFGLKRMAEEEVKGPTELVQEHSDEDEEDSDLQMEKLRQYQLNRLKYYYAVIVFDSAGTANKVYTECDGIEYESSATKLDLRFIPDDMTFDGQEPKETCDQLPEMTNYKPRIFANTALQQAKVDLTWDETNSERKEFNDRINKANLDELNKNDLQAYLASGTSDEEQEEDRVKKAIEKNKDTEGKDSIATYKLLLKAIEEEDDEKKKKDEELEFTWGLGEKSSDEEEQEEKDNLTPFEKYLEKRKEKRRKKKVLKENDHSDSEEEVKTKKAKKLTQKDDEKMNEEDQKRNQELELLLMDKDDDNKHHFNMKQIEKEQSMSKSKKKRLQKKNKNENAGKEDNFSVNVDDPRFSALYTSHKYNIDPTDPNYKKTKGTEDLVKEQIKRRDKLNKNGKVVIEPSKKDKTTVSSKITPELAALVSSVKRKTETIHKKIK